MAISRYILILLLCLSKYCYSQKTGSDSLIKRFRSDIQNLLHDHSGVIELDDKTNLSYYSVIAKSSIKDLIKYTDDSNAVVRSYIFAGLIRQKVGNDVLFKILDQHKNDTATFITKSADVVISWSVKEFMNAGMAMKSENKLVDIDYRKEIDRILRKSESTSITN